MSASFPMLLPPPVTKPVLRGVGAPVWFEDLRHRHHPGSVLKLEYPQLHPRPASLISAFVTKTPRDLCAHYSV